MKNPNVRINNIEILSDNWYTLNKVNFDYLTTAGHWQNQNREAYDRGNGAAILLYNTLKKTIILTRQFRMPTYLNGNEDGMMLEVPAGVLDEDKPEDCIIREVEEETGYRIPKVEKIFEAYMSPGAVTEVLHYFIAEYTDDMKTGSGGGLVSEHEDIEVLELPFETAFKMIASGEIRDAKSIILLQYARIHNLL